jgi:hypothetical protein
MNNFRIEYLHPLTVLNRWDEILPHIIRVIKVSNGELTEQSVKDKNTTGQSVMIAIFNADNNIVAITTAEVAIYNSGLRALLMPIIGGNNFFEWAPEWFKLMKELAVQLNCTELRGLAVRKGWMGFLKPYGWEEAHTVITCQIGDEL